MATVSELRILIRFIEIGSRSVRGLERELGRADAAITRQTRAQTQALSVLSKADQNYERVKTTGAKRIATAQEQLDKAYEATSKSGAASAKLVASASKQAVDAEASAFDQVIRTHEATFKASQDAAKASQQYTNLRTSNLSAIQKAEQELATTNASRVNVWKRNSAELAAATVRDNKAIRESQQKVAEIEQQVANARKLVQEKESILGRRRVAVGEDPTKATAREALLRAEVQYDKARSALARNEQQLLEATATRDALIANKRKGIGENLVKARTEAEQRIADFDKQVTDQSQALSQLRVRSGEQENAALAKRGQARQQLVNVEAQAANAEKSLIDTRTAGLNAYNQAVTLSANKQASSAGLIARRRQQLTQVEQQEAAKVVTALKEVEAAQLGVARASATSSKAAAIAGTVARTGAVVAGVAAIATSAAVVKLGYDYNSLRESSTAAFSGLLKSGPQANRLIEDLYSWTRKTSLGFETATESAAEFIARGVEVNKVIPYLQIIGDTAASLPRPIEQSMARISYAIGQIGQSAKLHSQDIRQLTEAGVPAWRYLSEATGKSIDEMQENALQFGLTGQRVVEIILAGMQRDFAGMLEVQRSTARGQLSVARRNIQELSGEFTKPIFEQFKRGITSANEVLGSEESRNAAREYGLGLAYIAEQATNATKALLGIPKTSFEKLTGIKSEDLGRKGLLVSPKEEPITGFIRSLGRAQTPEGQLDKARNELAKLQAERQRLLQPPSGLPEVRVYGQAAEARAKQSESVRTALERVDTEATKWELTISSLESQLNKASSATSEFDRTMSEISKTQAELTKNEERLKAIPEDFKKLLDVGSADAMRAEIAVIQDQTRNIFTRSNIGRALDELGDRARSAADAIRTQEEAIDKQISLLQRQFDAEDSKERRAELVQRLREIDPGKTKEERAAAQKARVEAEKDIARFDRDIRRQSQLQQLQDQREAVRQRGEAEQAQFNKEEQRLQKQLRDANTITENLSAQKTILDNNLKISQLEFDLVTKLPPAQSDLLIQITNLKNEFQATTTAAETFRTELAKLKAPSMEQSNVITALEQFMVNMLPEGRQFGGAIEPGRFYKVHRDEIIYNRDRGMVVPAGGNSSKSITNLAPITVYIGGQPKRNDNLVDLLFQGM